MEEILIRDHSLQHLKNSFRHFAPYIVVTTLRPRLRQNAEMQLFVLCSLGNVFISTRSAAQYVHSVEHHVTPRLMASSNDNQQKEAITYSHVKWILQGY